MVLNALHGDPLPVYGDGQQVRNWIFVEDFARGIGHVLAHGVPGETYNVGGPDEAVNLDVVQRIISLTGASEDLIEYVTDRPGHDRRYSLGSEKVRALGWEAQVRFDEGLERTVPGTATMPPGGSRSAPATTARTTSGSTGGPWGVGAGRDARSVARQLGSLRFSNSKSRTLVLAAVAALDLGRRGVAVDRDVLDVELEVVGVLDRLVELTARTSSPRP